VPIPPNPLQATGRAARGNPPEPDSLIWNEARHTPRPAWRGELFSTSQESVLLGPAVMAGARRGVDRREDTPTRPTSVGWAEPQSPGDDDHSVSPSHYTAESEALLARQAEMFAVSWSLAVQPLASELPTRARPAEAPS
jgi:hypothetical protein